MFEENAKLLNAVKSFTTAVHVGKKDGRRMSSSR